MTFIQVQTMSLDTPCAGRGRGGGRGAPFGNSEQRRELRRPLSVQGIAAQISNIDLKNSFNINAQEFVPVPR